MIVQMGPATLGYTVSAALSGKDAWEIFLQASTDAVTNDLAMDGFTGLAVAQAMRDRAEASSIPRPCVRPLDRLEF